MCIWDDDDGGGRIATGISCLGTGVCAHACICVFTFHLCTHAFIHIVCVVCVYSFMCAWYMWVAFVCGMCVMQLRIQVSSLAVHDVCFLLHIVTMLAFQDMHEVCP